MQRHSSCRAKGNKEQLAYFEILLFTKKSKDNYKQAPRLVKQSMMLLFHFWFYYACHMVASWHNLNTKGLVLKFRHIWFLSVGVQLTNRWYPAFYPLNFMISITT